MPFGRPKRRFSAVVDETDGEMLLVQNPVPADVESVALEDLAFLDVKLKPKQIELLKASGLWGDYLPNKVLVIRKADLDAVIDLLGLTIGVQPFSFDA